MVKLDLEQQRTRRRRSKEPVLIETVLGVLAVVCIMLAALLIFSMVHAGGTGGEILFSGIQAMIGVFTYITPLVFLYAAFYLWKEELPYIRFMGALGTMFLLIGVTGLGTIFFGNNFGGLLGELLVSPLEKYFTSYPTIAFLSGLTAIGGIIILERKPSLSPFLSFVMYPISIAQMLWQKRKDRAFDDEGNKPHLRAGRLCGLCRTQGACLPEHVHEGLQAVGVREVLPFGRRGLLGPLEAR